MTQSIRTSFLDEQGISDDVDNRAFTPGTPEGYFAPFRNNIIGHHQVFQSPFGPKKIIYADWMASGKGYRPIEECIGKKVMPFLANTHSGTTITATLMSRAYEEARLIIKRHVNADENDVLLLCGSGMTGAVNKLQRILGMRPPERMREYLGRDPFSVPDLLRPIVFISHMEHHSNQVSWLETIADVEIIRPCENGNIDLAHLQTLLETYKHRKNKMAAVTACSNVTGVETPYNAIAKLMHQYNGWCFVDFAASAPYVEMNMHPRESGAHLDAIYFSPHKFLGGPSTPGVLVFSKTMYKNQVPDQPGGGTVSYSNPWKVHEYVADIEQREDGGTPPFLQGMKVAMCLKLKEQMGTRNIRRREEEILQIMYSRFSNINNIGLLEKRITKRLAVVSFIVYGAHYNLVAKILNDRYGIQARGGCSCAATYGHFLLQVDTAMSQQILKDIRAGDLSSKPGWVRLSLHPAMTNADIHFIMDAITEIAAHFAEWSNDYTYDPQTNEYAFRGTDTNHQDRIDGWFDPGSWE